MNIESIAIWLEHSLFYHLDIEKVIDQAEQEPKLTDHYVYETLWFLILSTKSTEKIFEEHDWCGQWSAEFMWDRRSVRFNILWSIALLKNLWLELHCIYVVCHATKVDGSALFTLVWDFLNMDWAKLIFKAFGLACWQFSTGLYHVYSN